MCCHVIPPLQRKFSFFDMVCPCYTWHKVSFRMRLIFFLPDVQPLWSIYQCSLITNMVCTRFFGRLFFWCGVFLLVSRISTGTFPYYKTFFSLALRENT